MKQSLTTLFLALATTTAALASTHSLVGFERAGKQTVVDSMIDFQAASAPLKKGWRDYIVELSVKKSYEEAGVVKVWNDKVNVHFTSQKQSTLFSSVIATERGTDLYYEFSQNPYNSKGANESCNFLGSFCKDHPVKMINYTDLDADEVYAFDKRTSKNVELSDYLDSIQGK